MWLEADVNDWMDVLDRLTMNLAWPVLSCPVGSLQPYEATRLDSTALNFPWPQPRGRCRIRSQKRKEKKNLHGCEEGYLRGGGNQSRCSERYCCIQSPVRRYKHGLGVGWCTPPLLGRLGRVSVKGVEKLGRKKIEIGSELEGLEINGGLRGAGIGWERREGYFGRFEDGLQDLEGLHCFSNSSFLWTLYL